MLQKRFPEKIKELADEITASAREKLKEKEGSNGNAC